MWNTTEYKATVKELTEVMISFIYSGTKNILQARKSCSCTTTEWVNPNNLIATIKTDYVQDAVPIRLYEQGKKSYVKNAYIEIIYDDETSEYLAIELTVEE